MTRSAEYRAYEYAMEVLASNRIEDFDQLHSLVDSFPHGADELFGRPWIHNAIDCGSMTVVRWMLDNNVDLSVRDENGNSPLHLAVVRDLPNKYEILDMLLRAGAPVEAQGDDDLTPADLAAALGDGEALQLLADYGADLPIAADIGDAAARAAMRDRGRGLALDA